MKFKLIINGSGTHSLDEDVLLEALRNNLQMHEDYVVLEPKTPIDYNAYLQVMYDKNEGYYILETRFLFEDNTYKHYTFQTSEINDVNDIFLEYFQKGTLSSLSKWTTESSEDENYMCKLYKKDEDVISYIEFWINDENTITVHKGDLGEIGETEELNLPSGESTDLYVEKLEANYIKQGYAVVEDLNEMIIQYVADDEDDKSEMLEALESEMNAALGWTGNGHCEGGDIDDAVVSVFCQVVDREIALDTMLSIFTENGMLSNITISSPDAVTEEYEVLYPLK